MSEVIVWKFKQYVSYGFLIPDDRDYYGWDFYISKNNYKWAVDGDRVEWTEIKNVKWKKPEAKILKVIDNKPKVKWPRMNKTIEWIFSWWAWNFWFIDIEGEETWYFVYGWKKNWAKDWDVVRAEVKLYNWKEEAIVIEILPRIENEIVIWVYKDNDKFWFVLPDDRSSDIFIAWSRKWGAVDWDRVECIIIKRTWKNPEGIIRNILKI